MIYSVIRKGKQQDGRTARKNRANCFPDLLETVARARHVEWQVGGRTVSLCSRFSNAYHYAHYV